MKKCEKPNCDNAATVEGYIWMDTGSGELRLIECSMCDIHKGALDEVKKDTHGKVARD